MNRDSSIFSGRLLGKSERVQLGLLVGVAAAIAAALAFQRYPEMLARDFTYPWRGARVILQGGNPYDVIRPIGPPPNDMWFMYPLTAALVALPLAGLSAQAAGALFAGVGAALLTYAISDRGMGRLWILLSTPFAMAVVLAQWSPLLIAGALLTPLAWSLTCKPIGLALYISRPAWRVTLICAAAVLMALLVQPSWVADWIRNTRTLTSHRPPVFHPIGAFALLALLRWRMPEARLVAAMSLMPQNLYYYDQLPLLLAARTGRGALLLTTLSWIAWGFTRLRCSDPHYCGADAVEPILTLIFVPATLLVLLREDGPAWVGSQWVRSLRERIGADRSGSAGE